MKGIWISGAAEGAIRRGWSEVTEGPGRALGWAGGTPPLPLHRRLPKRALRGDAGTSRSRRTRARNFISGARGSCSVSRPNRAQRPSVSAIRTSGERVATSSPCRRNQPARQPQRSRAESPADQIQKSKGVAGAPGFEPGIAGPKPAALPLGYAPSMFADGADLTSGPRVAQGRRPSLVDRSLRDRRRGDPPVRMGRGQHGSRRIRRTRVGKDTEAGRPAARKTGQTTALQGPQGGEHFSNLRRQGDRRAL